MLAHNQVPVRYMKCVNGAIKMGAWSAINLSPIVGEHNQTRVSKRGHFETDGTIVARASVLV